MTNFQKITAYGLDSQVLCDGQHALGAARQAQLKQEATIIICQCFCKCNIAFNIVTDTPT